MSRLGNLGKQFAVDAIDDFLKCQSQYVRHHVVKPFVIWRHPVSIVSGQLT